MAKSQAHTNYPEKYWPSLPPLFQKIWNRALITVLAVSLCSLLIIKCISAWISVRREIGFSEQSKSIMLRHRLDNVACGLVLRYYQVLKRWAYDLDYTDDNPNL